MGYVLKFEHIKGKNNVLAEILSRKLAGIKNETILLLEDTLQET